VLIRLLVGAVFLSEGIQKFLFPAELGAGRFAKIGIPWPQVTGPFVGTLEIVAGTLILLGLLTRLAAFVLFINISVAILSTKIAILLVPGYPADTPPRQISGWSEGPVSPGIRYLNLTTTSA
jgi:putative oxidoreductase